MTSFMKEFEKIKIQLEEVKRATGNFDKSKVIGSGGFGTVFEGEVSHSKGRSIAAIKRLNREYGQGDPEFLKEIMMLSRYTHQNIVSLLGFCDEGDEKILVYEHASNGSLDRHLGDPSLTWTQRLNICLGAAKGLSFLHDPNPNPKESYQRVLHCDIKSSNILLDENLNAKVADFGLAKMGPANQPNTVLLTNAVGTPGYCDPQYMKSYTLTKESDIYSFGVVLFEVLCGKLCCQIINGQLKVFVPMWKKCYTEKKLDKIIFQDLLMQETDPTSLETFSSLAFQCLHESREKRPIMSLVVKKLELALESQKHNSLTLYQKILETAVDPLVYRSLQELKVLLSKGIFLNKGQTWFSLNDKRLHHVMISIDSLAAYKGGDYRSRYSHDYNSRFQVGTYNTCGKSFSIRGRFGFEFLSPGITYMVNLVFKCPDIFKNKHTGKQAYIAITYELKGEEEKRSSIVHIGDKREDEWLMVGLYHFTTTTIINQSSDNTILDLRIRFEDHEYWKGGLEIEGIEFQPLENLEFEDDDQVLIDEYQEILEAAAYPPLIYRSVQELKLLLSKGLYLNKGQTWFSLNDKGLHHVMISIDSIATYKGGEYESRYSHHYNSRFQLGTYNTCGKSFSICGRYLDSRVGSEFLSPGITYMVNLVFKCPDIFKKKHTWKQAYIAIRYKLKGKKGKRSSIVHIGDKREDEWLMVGLYHVTTTTNNNQSSNNTILDLQIDFEDHEYWKGGLEIEGIEFQPLENVKFEDDDQVLIDEYQEILEAAAYPPLIYRSVQELKLLLSKGLFLNKGQTWFYLNDNGQHCEMISIAECLIRYEGKDYNYSSDYNSRFKAGSLTNWKGKFRTRVRTQFLSPYITYSVNLVFKFHQLLDKDNTVKQCSIGLNYKLHVKRETWIISNTWIRLKTWNSYLANKREDNWWTVELCQFTSDGKTFDLEISFEGFEYEIRVEGIQVEGIEFQPLEKAAKDQVLEAEIEKEADIPDSDNTYWEQKLPNDYEDIIKWSKYNLQWTTKKELYSIFCKGFLINNDQLWFFLDKNGKRCYMLSSRTAFIDQGYETWQSLPESRFGEALTVDYLREKRILINIKSRVLSSQTKYASYLVYKLPEYYTSKSPAQVSDDDWNNFWYIYLSSPQTPVIVRRVDKNTHNPVNRTNIKDVPQQRSDGWMEVKVYEFQTDTTMGAILSLSFKQSHEGFIIQGIELRSV